jgi:hypothetical protein
MKFSMFKKGKPKEKNEKIDTEEDTGVQLTDLEEELNNRTSKLVEKQKQLESLSAKSKKDAVEVSGTPHGPAEELKVEPQDKADPLQTGLEASAAAPPDESGEEIKVVEVKAEAVVNAPEKPPEDTSTATEEKKDDSMSQSLNQLFQSEEEEENPLANLIKGLPDVSADELIKDLNEIRDIIKEWQKKT